MQIFLKGADFLKNVDLFRNCRSFWKCRSFKNLSFFALLFHDAHCSCMMMNLLSTCLLIDPWPHTWAQILFSFKIAAKNLTWPSSHCFIFSSCWEYFLEDLMKLNRILRFLIAFKNFEKIGAFRFEVILTIF